MQQQRRRRIIIIGLLSLGVLAGVALTASPAQAASGPGPYYAVPAWDQKIPTATRFVVLTDWGNAAVLDNETGLVWERSPVGNSKTWAAARLACTAVITGNRKGWRLPSVHELASLVHPLHTGPALPSGHPFLDVILARYWSATTNADNPVNAWDVNFNNGFVNTDIKTDVSHLAWCVRVGMNAEAY